MSDTTTVDPAIPLVQDTTVDPETQQRLLDYWLTYNPNAGVILTLTVWDDGATVWDDGETVWIS
jgi:hypothetical protein